MELKLKYYNTNQWQITSGNFETSWYDTALIVYAVSMANEVNKLFGVRINIPDTLIVQANHYRGKKVYGNIKKPQGISLREDWSHTWSIIENYDYDSARNCHAITWDKLTKDELIKISTDLINCLSEHNILDESFVSLMGRFDFSCCWKADEDALRIINYYKPCISENALHEGIVECNKLLKNNRDIQGRQIPLDF